MNVKIYSVHLNKRKRLSERITVSLKEEFKEEILHLSGLE